MTLNKDNTGLNDFEKRADSTSLLYAPDKIGKPADNPVLFISQGKIISEYRLEGHQIMGRPTENNRPDIPVFNRYVSRKHGLFDTANGTIRYTPLESTNGTRFKDRLLKPNESVVLSDGDELIIPYGDSEESYPALMIIASSKARIRLWREFQQASKDDLTGLYGRDGFSVWWYQNYNNKDYDRASLFILDIDDFKALNDTKGHNEGDVALMILARQLRNMVRYDNQVCRWGGDEFVGIVPGTKEQVRSRLSRLTLGIREEALAAGLNFTVSIGFVDSESVEDRADITSLVDLADKAMYSIKKDGKNNIACFTC